MQNIVLINNSWTALPTKIWMQLLSVSDNLFQGAFLIKKKKKKKCV